MSRNITVGIDVGTYQVKVIVAENAHGNESHPPRIIGRGLAESKGLRHGYIINTSDVIRSIEQAVAEAEKTSGVQIKKAFVSVGGIGLASTTAKASIVITRADSEVTSLDIEKVQTACEEAVPSSLSQNRKTIHAVPLDYKLDGRPVFGDPLGLKGNKLEVSMLFISTLEHHLNDLIEAVEEAGIEVIDVMASPIAASFVSLTKTQKIAGCVLANIGAETITLVVFENNKPLSLEVFPIGSTDITNDIALGFKIPLEEAEQIKRGGLTPTSYPRKKLDEIIEARLSDMFDLIEAHLKKINKSGLLPAGIVITGGGSGIGTIEDFARNALRLPSRVGMSTNNFKESSEQFKDSSWSVAYGLCIFGLTYDGSGPNWSPTRGLQGLLKKIGHFFKQFLP